MDIYNKINEGFNHFIRLYSECGRISICYKDGELIYEHPELGVILREKV